MCEPICIAGIPIVSPDKVLVRYAQAHPDTISDYDLPGPRQPDILTREDVVRTQILRSRISKRELEWFLGRAGEAPWAEVPGLASLADADPDTSDGLTLYQAGDRLFAHFMHDRPAGVNLGKISKVLHVKRPYLVPILDQYLQNLYRRPAREAAERWNHLAGGHRRLFWLAVRVDLIDPHNRASLTQCRDVLANHEDPRARAAAGLSDLRLLDILSWEASKPRA